MITFKLDPDDGEPYELVAHSRDVLLWEKGAKGRSFGQFGDNPNMIDMYGMAFVAARRQGLFSGTLQEFEQTIDVLPVDDDEESEPDPTDEGPSPGPSLSLPSPPASPPPSGRKKATARS